MDFYERNKISRPVPNAPSRSQLLDGRSRESLLRNAYRMCRRSRLWRGIILWAWVSEVTGHGSGYSEQICRELGWDPNMRVGPKADLP
jgi:hypothetical protein